MKNIPDNIKHIGFDRWFQDHIIPENLDEFEIARVISVHKDSYVLTNGKNDAHAELVGKLIFAADSPLDRPTVGDWVFAQFYDDNTFAIIHENIPRKSLLKRKTSGKNVEYQLIAANIDTAFIVQSLDANFNISRLERYLVMIHESDIQPVVLLSKSDLLTSEEIENKINEIRTLMPQLQIQPFSNKNGCCLENVRDLLVSGQTYCLLGSSGVGKTTLLNNLMGESLFRTKTVREKDSRGRHSTTYRQLIRLDSGAMIIDTPGMRELGILSSASGLDETFSEITELSKQCRFSNCTHVSEKGCAILKAVNEGRLSEKRYQNYMKIHKESVFNEMSYAEKRQKDKQFGKLCKTIMKHKKNKR